MGCYDSSILRPLLSDYGQQQQQAQQQQPRHRHQEDGDGTIDGVANDDINHNLNSHCSQKNNRRFVGKSASSAGGFSFWRRKRQQRAGYDDFNDNHDDDEDQLGSSVSSRQRRRHPPPATLAQATRQFVTNMKEAGRKIRLLIWKNFLLRKRHYIVTCCEVLLPTLFTLILVYGRSKQSQNFQLNGDTLVDVSKFKAKTPTSIFPVLSEDDFKLRCSYYYMGSSSTKCLVAYAPNTPEVNEIISKLKQQSSNIEWRGYENEAKVEQFIASLKVNEITGGNETLQLRAAIIFESPVNSVQKISYKLQMVDTSSSFTSDVMSSVFPWLQLPGPDYNNLNRYKESGFSDFQIRLDRILIDKFSQHSNYKILLQAFPYPPYESLNFNEIYYIVLPNILILGFVFIVPAVIRGVVSERETGIKELMKLSGIPNWMHWFAWIINSILWLSISVTIVIVLLFSSYLNQDAGPIITQSDPSVWWIVLFLYALSATTFCFFISAFFQKPTLGITVGIILWLTTYYAPSVPLGDSNKYLALNLGEKLAIALFPNMALTWALKVMCGFEGKASGAHWYNLFEPLSTTDSMTLAHILFMFIVDTFVYLLLTLYVEAVFPSQYGIRKPWYFIFLKSTWCPETKQVLPSQSDEASHADSSPAVEFEPNGLKVGVEVKRLRKTFKGNKVAVDGLSLRMFDGEIFALLGHNGAGKTTTISCCIGMISPTSGTVLINGYDITNQMDLVRESLGLCPQHNLLFDELTVDEHLEFFGRLKGLDSGDSKVERSIYIKKLQLAEKARTLARDLSGGQKRKLCLGISLIGKAKVVFLDEPTSGMDVEARRAIWDLLLEERGRRTIILTTHFMEEADVLGDRIGIMSHGKLQCCGSSMFLKKYYGNSVSNNVCVCGDIEAVSSTGYTLTCVLSNLTDDTRNEILSTVRQHIPAANVKSSGRDANESLELSIIIPTDSNPTPLFPDMFRDLQTRRNSCGILSIGLSLTTMDEVFIKAGKEIDNDSDFDVNGKETGQAGKQNLPNEGTALNNSKDDTKLESNGVDSMRIKNNLQGLRLWCEQFTGLLLKRILYTWRKWGLMLTQVSLPVAILAIAILAGNTQLQPPSTPPPIKIDISSYKQPETLYFSSNEELAEDLKKVVGDSAIPFQGNSSVTLIQGLVDRGITDLAKYRERYIVAADINSSHIKALYSTIPFHSCPLAVNLATNTLLASKGITVTITNHPIHNGYDYLLQALQPDPAFSVVTALMFGALAPIGLALLAASYIVSPLEERLCKGKQLQLMTGVNPLVYWGASFVWDFCVTFFVVITMVLCFLLLEKGSTYTSYGGAGVIFLILIAYGFSAIPFSYLCSLFSGTVAGGFSFVTIIHIITGMMLSFLVYILETSSMHDIANPLRLAGRFFPTFGASVSTMRFIETALKNGRCSLLPSNTGELLCNPSTQIKPEYRQCCGNCHTFANAPCMKALPYITWNYHRPSEIDNIFASKVEIPGIGQDLLFLILLGLGYFFVLIVIEYGFIQRLISLVFKTNSKSFKTNLDEEDVVKETERARNLLQGNLKDDALVVVDLCKNYGSLAAVSNLSFGVHHGECFGLLGVNGAGKTTTFRMLTGDEILSSGNVYAFPNSLEKNRKQFLANLGYCPQFDGIIGFLTGREMVELFGRLRGVTEIHREATSWLIKVGLIGSENVPCRKYSGGMKRRLSAAMAMIGDPEIVLLDEPTSGVDPVSRREFWKIINSIRESGRAIILTSHSMDEISACCSRLGIMVNGQLQCFGSVSHLKTKYAQGYTLAIKLSSRGPEDSSRLTGLENAILKEFSPCAVKDKHQTAIQFHIQNVDISWEVLFRTMEDLKATFCDCVEEYSITESTLEEVFLSFARKQYDSREADVSILRKLVTCQLCS